MNIAGPIEAIREEVVDDREILDESPAMNIAGPIEAEQNPTVLPFGAISGDEHRRPQWSAVMGGLVVEARGVKRAGILQGSITRSFGKEVV